MFIRSIAKTSFCTAAVIGIAAGCFVVPASAQDTTRASALEEIIVTARRREESLQKVPIAVTAMSSEDLERAGVNTVEDLRFHAPALQVTPSTFGTNVPGYTIRGQRQSSNIASQDTSALVYFADQVMARANGSNAVVYDLDSVQVLKGPQGTLFGRNTTGGAVLLNPKKPSFESGVHGEFTGEAGDYDMFGGTAIVDATVTDTFAIRLAGQFSQRDGYVDSLFDDQEFDDDETESWRVGLLWRPTDNIESYTLYQHVKQDNSGSAWKLVAVNPNSAALRLLRPEVIPRMQAQVTQLEAADFHTVATDLNGSEELDTYSISNTTTWTLGSITLKNIVGYRSVNSYTTLDYDGTSVQWNGIQAGAVVIPGSGDFGVFNSQHDFDADQVTEEFQLLGNAFGDRLNWIAGLYYFAEDAHDFQLSDLVGRRTNDGIAQNDSYSVFLQGTYQLPWEGLSLTAGARYTWDERELEQRNQVQAFNAPALSCRLTSTGAGGAQEPLNPCSRTNEFSDSAPTWTVSLDYQLTDGLLVYLTHRRGYRSGGLQLYTNRADEVQTFDPEFVDDYEIGAKSTWQLGDATFRVNAAVFRQDYEDIQRTLSFSDPRINNALTTLVVNAASATIDGGELEATIIPTDYFELSGFIGYVDAKYDRFINDRVNPPTVLTNNNFAWVPDLSAGVTMRVRLPLAASLGEIWLQGSWYTQTEQDLADINDAPGIGLGQLDGYDLFNAAVSWSGVLGNESLDARVTVKNVRDEEYYSSGLGLYSQTGISSRLLGPPRTVAAEVTYRFGQ